MEAPKIRIHETFEAAVLVCFLIDGIDALTEELLLEITTFDGIIEVFMLSDAIGMSEKKGLIKAQNKNNEVYYNITDYGKTILKEFKNTIPLSIREKTMDEGKRVYRLHRLKKSFKWRIEKRENGFYFRVNLLNEMGGPDIMLIKIYSPTYHDAEEIESRFLEKPAEIIMKTLDMFVNDSYL